MAKPGEGLEPFFDPRGEAVRRKLPRMEKVIGIGGVFFRARDPKALADWYETHLGVKKTPTDYGAAPWFQGAGPTVWGAFKQDSKYFPLSQAWMVNFRVKALDAMVKQLRDAGIKVDVDPEQYPNGRFARLYDPENNPIELWQPNGPYAGL